ncbi:phage portal protein [Rhizobium sp. YIM 134829]|uniref:phage portal protein n=1 Tax=Rhizobium sp. YIM 134829 TaxID=3390453 RepID=UPI00397D2551
MKTPLRKTPLRLPWSRPRAATEAKAVGMVALRQEESLGPSGRSYAALSEAGFLRNPVAYRTVRMVAEAAAALPLLLYHGEQERPDHPALALLAQPNPHRAGPDFLEALYGHLLLSGNAFLTALSLGGPPRELHLLRPDQVRIVEGRDGWPETYEYRAGTSVTRYAAAEGQLLHLRLFHPLDERLGFSPLAAARAALDLSNAASRWNKALLDNAARPSGALVYQPKEGGNLTADQYDRLRSELDEGYGGPLRAGRPLLLEGGLDWKAMGLSPQEMDFIEAKNGAARDIALALGVPPMLLGIPGDNTYANYQEANRAFYRLTVLPMATRSAAALSAWFSDLYGEPLRLVPDLDRVTGLAAEVSELWDRIGKASFLTEEEKRTAVGY